MKLLLPISLSLLLSFSSLISSATLHASDRNAPVSVLVFPNPSVNGVFSLELRTHAETGIVRVRVYDLIGNELWSERYDLRTGIEQGRISIENHPKGVYLLEITNGDRKQTLRLSYI